MIEQQVEVKIFAIHGDAFLAREESKIATQLDQKCFQVPQNGGFQILFGAGDALRQIGMARNDTLDLGIRGVLGTQRNPQRRVPRIPARVRDDRETPLSPGGMALRID